MALQSDYSLNFSYGLQGDPRGFNQMRSGIRGMSGAMESAARTFNKSSSGISEGLDRVTSGLSSQEKALAAAEDAFQEADDSAAMFRKSLYSIGSYLEDDMARANKVLEDSNEKVAISFYAITKVLRLRYQKQVEKFLPKLEKFYEVQRKGRKIMKLVLGDDAKLGKLMGGVIVQAIEKANNKWIDMLQSIREFTPALSSALDFKDSLNKMQSGVGLMGKDMDMIHDLSIKLAKSIGYAPEELSKVLAELAKNGVRDSAALEQLVQVSYKASKTMDVTADSFGLFLHHLDRVGAVNPKDFENITSGLMQIHDATQLTGSDLLAMQDVMASTLGQLPRELRSGALDSFVALAGSVKTATGSVEGILPVLTSMVNLSREGAEGMGKLAPMFNLAGMSAREANDAIAQIGRGKYDMVFEALRKSVIALDDKSDAVATTFRNTLAPALGMSVDQFLALGESLKRSTVNMKDVQDLFVSGRRDVKKLDESVQSFDLTIDRQIESMQAYTEATKLAFGRRAAELIHTYFIDPVFLGVRKLTKVLDEMPTSLKIAAGALTLFSGSFAFKWLFQVAKAVLVFKLGVKALNFTMSRSVAVTELMEKGFLKAGAPIDKLILSSGKLTQEMAEGAVVAAKQKAALAGLSKTATLYEKALRGLNTGMEFTADLMIQGSKTEKFFRARAASTLAAAEKIATEGGAAVGQRWYKGIVDFFPQNKLVVFTKKTMGVLFDAKPLKAVIGSHNLFSKSLNNLTLELTATKASSMNYFYSISKSKSLLKSESILLKSVGQNASRLGEILSNAGHWFTSFSKQVVVDTVKLNFPKTIENVNKLGKSFKAAGSAIKDWKITKFITNPWTLAVLGIGTTISLMDKYGGALKKAISTGGDWVMKLPDFMSEMAEFPAKLLDQVAGFVKTAISGMWDSIFATATSAGPKVGKDFGDGFAKILGKYVYGIAASMVSWFADSLISGAELLVSAVFNVAELMLIAFIKPLGMLWEKVTKIWNSSGSFLDFVSNMGSSIWSGIVSLGTSIKDFFVDSVLIPLGEAVLQPFRRMFAYLADRTADFFQKLAPYVSVFSESMSKSLQDAALSLRYSAADAKYANEMAQLDLKGKDYLLDQKSASLSEQKVKDQERINALMKAAGNDEKKRFMMLQMMNRTFLNTGGNIFGGSRQATPGASRANGSVNEGAVFNHGGAAASNAAILASRQSSALDPAVTREIQKQAAIALLQAEVQKARQSPYLTERGVQGTRAAFAAKLRLGSLEKMLQQVTLGLASETKALDAIKVLDANLAFATEAKAGSIVGDFSNVPVGIPGISAQQTNEAQMRFAKAQLSTIEENLGVATEQLATSQTANTLLKTIADALVLITKAQDPSSSSSVFMDPKLILARLGFSSRGR